MSIGLNANMKQGSVKLNTLNVVILLDTSSGNHLLPSPPLPSPPPLLSSPSHPLSSSLMNYSDMLKPFQSGDEKSKLAVTTESVVALMVHLSENNNLGIVSYEDKLEVLDRERDGRGIYIP